VWHTDRISRLLTTEDPEAVTADKHCGAMNAPIRQMVDDVYEWIRPRAARASGVTVREAVKPLSEEQLVAR
jgi:hypothetical protein